MFIRYNANPVKNIVGDCVIRAISKALNEDWETVYLEIALLGLIMYDMPSSNNVWETYLWKNGFRRFNIPNTCPDCYSVKEFCKDNPEGIFVLGTGSHAIAIINGNYYDTWDSGEETPIYCFRKEY